MLAIIGLGALCLAIALFTFPPEKLSLQFVFLSLLTIAFGSRISIQIPRFKSHIAVSDTFIFLAILLFGGEAAIILSAVEAFFSSWRFCKKKISVFFNAALLACSTTFVVSVLRVFEIDGSKVIHEEAHTNLAISLSVMALVQFVFNSGLASIYGALKSGKPWWETWKTHYLWTSVTYFVGAIAAGILAELVFVIGFGVIIAAAPIIVFIYLTYRMYLKNVEMSLSQAEQAEQHALILEEQSRALSESEERFRSAFTYAPIGIGIVSPDGKWLKVNKALSEILGYTEEEFLATEFQSMIYEDDLGSTLVKLHELMTGKVPACQLEQRYVNKRGEIVWVSWSVSATSDHKAERPNLIFQIQDITAKKLAEEQLQYKATHDALTGLPNRAYFMARLEQALEKSFDNPAHKVSVLFIDLDRFKIVNDSLGHQIGDELLIGIADRLRECLRPSDMVARLGGDEFTILVEGRYEPREVVRIAERIREKFLSPFNLSGHEIFSSASIGILHASDKYTKPEDVMRDADIAMYQAKRAGKARHETFTQHMRDAVKETLQIETDLRHAIEKQEFDVYYQPIYSFETDKIEGFEALARWEHKTLGMIPPSRFIPLAEEIGVIDALGEQILRRACQEGCLLQQSAPEADSFVLSVNISCKQFAQLKLAENIKQILEETNFSPQNLKLEITESVFLEHTETAIEVLRQLCDIGIEINIDDFGTGYSNLHYLTQFPITTLKIDRSFISPIKENGQNIEIVQTVMMLARSLRMKVIAEGVETEAQYNQLKDLNCEGAQGYFFGKAMKFEEARDYFREKNRPPMPLPPMEEISVVSTLQ
ncbi:MAG TPA: EAL domain-containing protein [Pyrinomonadaceae bacterium]|jgi:diguanylate cyclase (GGDEF)-like protein/PAS domain S-box-containing protein